MAERDVVEEGQAMYGADISNAVSEEEDGRTKDFINNYESTSLSRTEELGGWDMGNE